MNTPKTLAAVKKTQASKDWFGRPIVAAEIMANMEEDYEKELAELRSKLARSQAAGTIWYRRCFGEDPEWESAKDAIVGKAVALVKFWEEQGGGNGVMARAKEDALILACGSLHNDQVEARDQ